MAGMVPPEVRIDFPSATTAGRVDIDWGEGCNPRTAEAVLIAILLGGMCDGSFGWDLWPIELEDVPPALHEDARQILRLIAYLKYGEADFRRCVWKANRFAKRKSFRRLVVAIGDELERVEVLNADDLRRIMEEVA